MKDENLKKALAAAFGTPHIVTTQYHIDQIKSAIKQDDENDRLFCKQVMLDKLKKEGKSKEGSNFSNT